jgi:ubiquinone/menaquinone biosynthesis C-methylase UbiE
MNDLVSYKNAVKGVFDRAAVDYGQGYCSYYDYFAEGLVNRAMIAPGEHVLDVATGRGAILKRVAKLVGPSGMAVGIDFSPEMIAQTSVELGHQEHLKLLCMDAEQLNFADGTFDKIFCGFALFFFPHVEQALKEFHRVLKPDGQIFTTTFRERDKCQQLLRVALRGFGLEQKLSLHAFEREENLHKTFTEAEFHDIQLFSDELDLVYPDPGTWVESLWSHGTRWMLEKLSDKQYRQLKEELCTQLKPEMRSDGFHESLRVFYTHAQQGAFPI